MIPRIRTLAATMAAELLYKHSEWHDMSFADAVRDKERRGLLKDAHEVRHNVWTANADAVGWQAIAFEMAFNVPGQMRVMKGGNGVSWINGAKGPHGVIISAGLLPVLLDCRDLLTDFNINDGPLDGFWSVGASARRLLTWAATPMPYESSVEMLLNGVPYGYHDCTPGEYKGKPEYIHNTEPSRDLFNQVPALTRNPEYTPALTMFDANAYYWNLLRRLESLRITPYRNGTVTQWPMPRNEKARWLDVQAAIEEQATEGNKARQRSIKVLRNSMAGVMAGSLKPGIAYCRDRDTGGVKRIEPPGNRGPFAAAGLLVVRMGVELCLAESLQTESVYSTIDSVTSRGKVPQVWPKYGIPYGVRAEGDGEIVSRGVWRIGPRQTKRFGKGEEMNPVPRLETLPVQYHLRVL